MERRAYAGARRYLAGADRGDALVTIARLHATGLATSVDCFGEARTDAAAVERVTGEYLRLNRELAVLDRPVNVWVDCSNLGLDISVDLCRRQLERIVETLPAGARLQVRAHDSARAERILDLVLALGAVRAPVTPTLQANLRRSADDVARLVESRLPVLLVKGAHLEPHAVAHPWGEETDLAYIRLAHELHDGGTELTIGTHDAVLREALLAALPGVRIEMLLGVLPDAAAELVGRGDHVRVYVPYGDDWFRYWLRRLGEARGAASG